MKPETLVAIYAAIIGTSAFLLNLKAWFDSGVILKLSLIADGMTIGAGPAFDERDLSRTASLRTKVSVAGKRNFAGRDKGAETPERDVRTKFSSAETKRMRGSPPNRGNAQRAGKSPLARSSRYRTGLSRVIHRGNSAL
jgi:hypothetical protein